MNLEQIKKDVEYTTECSAGGLRQQIASKALLEKDIGRALKNLLLDS